MKQINKETIDNFKSRCYDLFQFPSCWLGLILFVATLLIGNAENVFKMLKGGLLQILLPKLVLHM